MINTAFIQPSDTATAFLSEDQYEAILQIYENSPKNPYIKIPAENTHVSVELDLSLPANTIQYPTADKYFNAKQREYLLATPDSPVHTLFSIK